MTASAAAIHRVAVYYAPAADDPLALAAASWFAPGPRQAITTPARHYGFHATLKAPFRLRDGCGWSDVLAAAGNLACGVRPFSLPPLAVAVPHGFLALRETNPSPPLQALADAAVAELDHLRAPPAAAEIARRQPERLGTAERRMLDRWGYPYCFATWFFHMTLSQRLDAAEQAHWRPRAEAHFAPALALPRQVDAIALFVQPAPDVAFTEAARLPFRG
ncbi:MAG: DUF1045 domain-containing protein [Rhodospirillales bacterium]|nr:DUF1045 domain-containing protein [Rhodospirillales bacterium]